MSTIVDKRKNPSAIFPVAEGFSSSVRAGTLRTYYSIYLVRQVDYW